MKKRIWIVVGVLLVVIAVVAMVLSLRIPAATTYAEENLSQQLESYLRQQALDGNTVEQVTLHRPGRWDDVFHQEDWTLAATFTGEMTQRWYAPVKGGGFTEIPAPST